MQNPSLGAGNTDAQGSARSATLVNESAVAARTSISAMQSTSTCASSLILKVHICKTFQTVAKQPDNTCQCWPQKIMNVLNCCRLKRPLDLVEVWLISSCW